MDLAEIFVYKWYRNHNELWCLDWLSYYLQFCKCTIMHSQDQSLNVYPFQLLKIRQIPVGIWCQNDVVSTLMRRHHSRINVDVTSIWHQTKMMSYQRWCDVITSHQRWYDVILAPNAYWDSSEKGEYVDKKSSEKSDEGLHWLLHVLHLHLWYTFLH